MPLKSNSDGQIVNVRARFAWDGKIVIADSPALDRWVEIPKLSHRVSGFSSNPVEIGGSGIVQRT